MSFIPLGLAADLQCTCAEIGYKTPTAIQKQAIPAVLSGRDVMATAQTGTGKTASFVLPILQQLSGGQAVRSNHIRALILTPTRELAVQVADSVATYGKSLSLKSCVVYGGVKINPQMMKLRGGVDILVATPGRLIDLCKRNAVKLGQVEILVLDEADRMLDMGFRVEIDKILKMLPLSRQNLLFSATFSPAIDDLTRGLLKNPLRIEISARNSAPKTVKQLVYEVDKSKKPELLSHLIRNNDWSQVLVFVRTKKGADQLVRQLKGDNISAVAIHGDKSQGLRTRALKDFKANKTRILVATDIAARGLDINELPHVINFDLPKIPEDYVHRIGRTGRARLKGEALSLVSADEVKSLAAIESLIQQTLVREVETGFVPNHKVPLTRQTRVKPKKPKKNKPVVPQTDVNDGSARSRRNVGKSSSRGKFNTTDSGSKAERGRGRRTR